MLWLLIITMRQRMLSINVLECLAEFIFLHLGKTFQLEEIQAYIEPKLIEKELMNSYNHGLITKEEVCDFVLAHLYTKFVLFNDVRPINNEQQMIIRNKLKELLFNNKD